MATLYRLVSRVVRDNVFLPIAELRQLETNTPATLLVFLSAFGFVISAT